MRRFLPALLVAASLAAQQPEEIRVSSRPYIPFGIRAASNLVPVGVVVRDRVGKAVPGLTKADFRLFDHGNPREITSFSMESRVSPGADVATPNTAAKPAASAVRPPDPVRPPRSLALYFEDFGTPTGDVLRTQAAARRFVQDGLEPTDRVALFTTSGGRITEFTSDRQAILAAIDNVRAHPRFQENVVNCPRMTAYDTYAIARHLSAASNNCCPKA